MSQLNAWTEYLMIMLLVYAQGIVDKNAGKDRISFAQTPKLRLTPSRLFSLYEFSCTG